MLMLFMLYYAELRIRKAILVGHSMGGYVALLWCIPKM
jgi:pimeloyl-ACP methyl ester carboxylesterase